MKKQDRRIKLTINKTFIKGSNIKKKGLKLKYQEQRKSTCNFKRRKEKKKNPIDNKSSNHH